MIELDPEDAIGSGCFGLLARSVAGLLAIFAGGLTTGVSVAAADWAIGTGVAVDGLVVVFGPVAEGPFGFGLYGLFSAILVWLFLRIDQPWVLSWGVLAGGVALLQFALCWLLAGIEEWPEVLVVAFLLVAQLGMMGTGLWFLDRWSRNRWARHMAMIQAANAARRAEMKDQFGTESFEPDPDDLGP